MKPLHGKLRPTDYQQADVTRGARAATAKRIERSLDAGFIPYGNRHAVKSAIKHRSNIRACRAARAVVASKVDAMIANRPLCRPSSKSSSEE